MVGISRDCGIGVAGSFLAVLLAASGAAGQVPSFSSARTEFEARCRSGSPEERVPAVARLAGHGHWQSLGYLVRLLDDESVALAKSRLQLTRAQEKSARLEAEVRGARGVLAGLRSGKLDRLLTQRKAARDQVERLTREVKQGKAMVRAIWTGLDTVVTCCPEDDRARLATELTSAYRRTKDMERRAALLRFMAVVDHLEIIEKEVDSRFDPVRVAALGAVEARGGMPALRTALRHLEDPVWQVRAAAIRILRRVGGASAARALVGVLEREKGRLATDALSALRVTTGQDFHYNQHLWKEWLDEEGHNLPEPTESENAPPVVVDDPREPREEEATTGRTTGFYGIRTTSRHLVYVIDFSGSMAMPLGRGYASPTTPSPAAAQPAGPARIGGSRKVDGAVTELLRSIESLPKDATFNVVLFNTAVSVWKPTMQPASRRSKDAIREWVLSEGPKFNTDFWGGLEKGFGFAGRGSFDKHYAVGTDTIFILSDGNPTAGRLLDPECILREVRTLNALRRISVNTVGLGRDVNRSFLQRLAHENDGEFAHIGR